LPDALTIEEGVGPAQLLPFFVAQGAIVGVLDWAQTKLAQTRTKLVSHRSLQVALWMNLLGIFGFLVVVAGKYDPRNGGLACGNSGFAGKFGLGMRQVG
jgi:hypothetical protein